MSYPGWMIAKWQEERAKNATPWKQMKDRNMNGVELRFVHGEDDSYYYLKEIVDPSEKITYDYIANLGGRKKRACSEWTHHGGGGWVKYVTLDKKEFTRMQCEVQRLGGTITLYSSSKDYWENTYWKYQREKEL